MSCCSVKKMSSNVSEKVRSSLHLPQFVQLYDSGAEDDGWELARNYMREIKNKTSIHLSQIG